eukprot:1388432-Amorphochlora_amoeboformis.AAC.1
MFNFELDILDEDAVFGDRDESRDGSELGSSLARLKSPSRGSRFHEETSAYPQRSSGWDGIYTTSVLFLSVDCIPEGRAAHHAAPCCGPEQWEIIRMSRDKAGGQCKRAGGRPRFVQRFLKAKLDRR